MGLADERTDGQTDGSLNAPTLSAAGHNNNVDWLPTEIQNNTKNSSRGQT